MMLPLAFILVAATPVEAIAHSLADYSECLRVNAGRPDRQAATERAQFAIGQCRSQRETSIRFVIGQLETPSNTTAVRARRRDLGAGGRRVADERRGRRHQELLQIDPPPDTGRGTGQRESSLHRRLRRRR